MNAREKLDLVGKLISPAVVPDDDVRNALERLLPRTELGPAFGALRRIEGQTGRRALYAVEIANQPPTVVEVDFRSRRRIGGRWHRPAPEAEPEAPPAEIVPRYPPRCEDVELVAKLASPAVVPDDDVRAALPAFMERSEIAPALWRYREIVWFMEISGREDVIGPEALEAWEEAEGLLNELVASPSEALGNARFEQPLLVCRIIDKVTSLRVDQPRAAKTLADLGLEVSGKLAEGPGTAWRRNVDLHAFAAATAANACRIVGEISKARGLAAKARLLIESVGEEYLRGECYGLLAATSVGVGALEDARKLANQAVTTFTNLGDLHRAAQDVVLQTHIHEVGGDVSQHTIRLLEQAQDWVDPFRQPEMGGVILTNLCVYQAAIGLTRQAHETWKSIPSFRATTSEMKRQAARGVIYLAEGQFELARQDFQRPVTTLREIGDCEWAYYALLLALAHLGAGNNELARVTSTAAARFLLDRYVGDIAVAAERLLHEMSCRTVRSTTIRQLARLIRQI